MSRIGKIPIGIPDKVKVQKNNEFVQVEGPKGKLQFRIPSGIQVGIEQDKVAVSRSSDSKLQKSLHGVSRTLISNMIKGVTEGYKKELEIIGVGFRAQIQGKNLTLQLGFSHPVEYALPEDVKISVPKPNQITVEGLDKAKVGQTAAEIRAFHKPEPYKGKGIRYVGEYVRRKQGKAVTK
ncbi:50S ribosomal protein L6 [Candidatus Omnitrophota bacterium]